MSAQGTWNDVLTLSPMDCVIGFTSPSWSQSDSFILALTPFRGHWGCFCWAVSGKARRPSVFPRLVPRVSVTLADSMRVPKCAVAFGHHMPCISLCAEPLHWAVWHYHTQNISQFAAGGLILVSLYRNIKRCGVCVCVLRIKNKQRMLSPGSAYMVDLLRLDL